MNPVVVHVVRPYSTEQDYLAAEAWTIDARGMLLIEAESLPMETAVLFDVALVGGHKLIRAEGRVMGLIAPSGDRPGGLRVRFKRFGAATKAFIERAVKAKSTGEPERQSQTEPERPSQPDVERPSDPEAERPSQPEAERPSLLEVERFSLPEVRASMTDLETPPLAPPMPSRDQSGTRQRFPGPVAAPANREELLARLRLRRQTG